MSFVTTLAVVQSTDLSAAGDAANEHIVIVRTAQTVEQVLTTELNSSKFARQIASYNNIASASTVLPVGTALAIPKPYIASLQFGRIAYVKGDVVHKQTDMVVNPPAKGSQVFNGDIIKTGEDGFVSLTFKSGARVHVQPDSRIVVNNIDCLRDDETCTISLQATEGQVGSEVTPRPDGKPPVQFSIETPFLTAAVRGTAFYVDMDDQVNRIGVTKGLVATQTSSASNDLPKGKGLSVEEGISPELVDLLEPPALSLTGERLLLSEEDDIAWIGLEGASAYRADIARDQEMAQQVVSHTTEDEFFNTPALEPGDYFLSVAGIDNKDFLGLPTKRQVAIAAITSDRQPELQVTRQDGLTRLSVPGYTGQVELLISQSVNGGVASSRIMENGSEPVTLALDPESDWVFRARKVLGPHQVSAYSRFYVFEAR